ncbi:MAG: DEAD/DEAH box helicase [Lachnospiraceae bacterium]|nr:DEAD/DEAH box helicase [Lachnospiraceae bacterium]
MDTIQSNIDNLQKGLYTAFIDSTYNSNLAYKPEFVSNDYKQGKKVLVSIEQELAQCEEFIISVAFITMSGITPLLQTLKELEQRNIPGKILTTDYLMFSEPAALSKLASLNNIELRMFCTNSETGGFHTKGYIFRREEIYRIIIGSSNMTLNAITKNREWNTKIVSTEDGEMTRNILTEFKALWNDDSSKLYRDFIGEYTTQYKIVKEQQRTAKREQIVQMDAYTLKPNKMQVAFIENVQKVRAKNAEKALLISSTGTGKTYASAFAMRELGFRKVLFLVHRNQIAKQALLSFQKVFNQVFSMGLVTGKYEQYDKDYIFATMQTMSKSENLHRFDKKHFDAIIIDEAHHSSANSYQKIMNYFEPDFWLGMTATPDKRDDNIDGRNIYEIFDHNIVYEIRLQQAMEEDLLCPFHYFGITDLQMISDTGNSKEERLENFRYLTSDERVSYVMNQADYYGYSGERVKGLIFCSRIDEAKELSAKFNQRGWRTMVLSGEDSEEVRADAIERLAGDECENVLDYILSVDIFSEGVDVVEINQVIMLRPTQSPIVFVQQLGRGLRKADGKEYVVILDFIGNYKNNFMIPIALSGDRSYNKDTIRRYVMEGSRVIPGSSTIHFDEISKSKIYAAIDRLSTPRKMLIEKYTLLKDKLGKIPSMIDFYDYGEIDPLLFINYAGTYHAFLQIADKEYQIQLTENENVTLEFLSQNVASGKRIYELLMLKQFLDYGELRKEEIEAFLREEYHKDFSEESYESSLNVLSGGFMNTQSEKKKYADINIVEYSPSRTYSRLYSYNQGVKQLPIYQQLSDLIQLGLCRYRDIYSENQDEMGLALYQKYSRKDVCRILNWERDDSSTVYGYKIKNGSCPIFVTYEKKDNIASSTKYEDVFLANNLFSWMTRSRVSLDSDETQKLIHYKENGLKILLFIKKSDGEGSDFYYMGLAEPIRWKQTEISNDDGKKLPIMNFQLQLAYSVRDDIYQYFVE